MSDFGIKITNSGADVTSTDQRDFTLNSKFKNMIRLQDRGNGSIDIAGAATYTITVPHNLGYPPFFQIFTKWRDRGGFFGFDTEYQNTTCYDIDPYFVNIEMVPTVDATNLYIDFVNPIATNYASVDYYYFIGRDPIE